MEGKKYCSNCGEELKLEAKFCAKCGTEVTQSEEKKEASCRSDSCRHCYF